MQKKKTKNNSVKTTESVRCQKVTYCMIPFIWNVPKQSSEYGQKGSQGLPGSGDGGGWRWWWATDSGLPLGDGNILLVVVIPQLWIHLAFEQCRFESHRAAHVWIFFNSNIPVVMYGCESWIIKMAEHRRIDAFKMWCWRRLSRVPWTARRSNQSISKEISSVY